MCELIIFITILVVGSVAVIVRSIYAVANEIYRLRETIRDKRN